MVTLYNNGKNDWKAWVLNIAIAIISGLMFLGIVNLTSQIMEIKSDLKILDEHNHVQDLCLKELQLNQAAIKANQETRLKREGLR